LSRAAIGLALAVLLLALALPPLAGPFWMGLATQMLIFGLLALSVDLLLGHTGLFSLCHSSFFAIAAYTVAILQVRYAVPSIVAGGAHARRVFHPDHHRAGLHRVGRPAPLVLVHRGR
jgi:branched-chain amino acid transport system permease protein